MRAVISSDRTRKNQQEVWVQATAMRWLAIYQVLKLTCKA